MKAIDFRKIMTDAEENNAKALVLNLSTDTSETIDFTRIQYYDVTYTDDIIYWTDEYADDDEIGGSPCTQNRTYVVLNNVISANLLF